MGHNNGGKSSAIRALYWILTNSPRGDWMQREVAGELKTAEAYVTFTDGTRIGRVKGNRGLNKYLMNDETWEKFGNNIPEPILDYINKLELPFGKNLLPNIHMQDDDPFMVTESSTARGALVNYLTGIDIGDKIKKDFNSQIKERTNKSSELESSIAELEIEYEEIEDVEKYTKKYSKVLKKHDKLKELETTIHVLNSRIKELQNLKVDIKQLPRIRKGAIKTITKLQTKLKNTNALRLAIRDALTVHESIKQVKLPKTNLDELQGVSEALYKLSKQPLKIEKQIASLKKSLALYNNIVKCQQETDEQLKKFRKELEKYKGKQCPTCGNTI